MSSPLARRLSNRRGSVTAADPHGAHASLNHSVQSSSTLTIVRVISPPPPPHRRLPSAGSDRLSFAASSFGHTATSPNTSPSSSPRIRPSSPHRLSANFPSAPRLSPDQLVDLARSQRSRVPYPEISPSQPSASDHHHHQSSAHPTFTPLPDDILLPFIDRPSEVAALISTPPSAKLFTLLKKTLAPLTEPSSDPSKWTYTQLHDHLTQVSRQQASDTIWTLQARRCIMSHSELIWERVKGALGVPPELDVDYDPSEVFLDDYEYSSSHSSIDTDELSDDFGRSARGHWEDWDAIMDSPVYDRRHSGPSSPVLPLTLNRQEDYSHLDSSLVAEHRPVSPSSTLLSIEPLLAPSPSNIYSTGGMLATSEIGGLGLDDIQEGAEEEEDSTTISATDDTPTEKDLELKPEDTNDPHLIAPSQIQGLRITTNSISLSDVSGSAPPSALPATLSTSSSISSASKVLSPISPLPPYNYPVPRSRPVSGTSARPQLPLGSGPLPSSVFRRSGSAGSLVSLRGGSAVDHRSDGEGERDGYASSVVSDASERFERPLGSPLFPSSFARLSVEPTLGLAESTSGGLKKQRTYSHGASPGGTVAGYKRLSWGATPGQVAPGQQSAAGH